MGRGDRLPRVIGAGDIHLADLGGERRRTVLVVSNGRFHRLAGRALVCPQMLVVPEELFPWWIDTDHGVFALDRLASLPTERLLDRLGCVGTEDLGRIGTALAAIT